MENRLSIPEHWDYISLVKDLNYVPTGVQGYEGKKKYYSTGSIKGKEYTPEGEYSFDERPSRANRIAEKNDVLQARMKGTNKALLINDELAGSLFSTGFFQVRPYGDTYEPKLLYYYLYSSLFLKIKDELCSGSTQSALNDTNAKKIKIPLPPLEEQRRIVDKIEALFSELESSIESLKRAKEKLKHYRQSVLKSAFEGRLTAAWRETHKEELEDAEVLLEHIKKEREAAYEKRVQEWQEALKVWEAGGREGKRPARPKKPKELPELSAEELENLPELPEGWKWSKIAHIAKVETGATPLKKNRSYYENGTIPWITSGALNDWTISEANEFITELAIEETNVKVFPKHTLLVAMYGEGKTRGKCSELLIDAATNQAVAALILMNSAKLIKDFLHWYMQKNYENIRMKASGGAQPNLNLDIIKNTIVPLAPQKEIKRVVNEIETRFSKADAMEKTIDASLQKAERLRQSILKQAFEGRLVDDL